MINLVTGGAGFIGSNLVRRLVENGDSVRVLDNLYSGRMCNIEDLLERIDFVEGDLRDRETVDAALDGVGCIFHLGAMPSAVEAVDTDFHELEPGDQVILNDPYRGGSHLPDITLIAPFFWQGKLKGYAANRAHHADVGGNTPGSMPGFSSTLSEEGIVIPPTLFVRSDSIQDNVLEIFKSGYFRA